MTARSLAAGSADGFFPSHRWGMVRHLARPPLAVKPPSRQVPYMFASEQTVRVNSDKLTMRGQAGGQWQAGRSGEGQSAPLRDTRRVIW